MSPKLLDFLDPNRPLAKAARDFDWSEVVGLFPEATQEGLNAGKIWVLASLIILGEVTGLSESEVLSRWPENPYWQSFAGMDKFQWTAPATQAECLNFKRHLTAERAAKLTKIAKSIRDSKTDPSLRIERPPEIENYEDNALAIRKLHFNQPQPAQPYKAPPRPDFHSSIKQTYARAAALKKKETEPQDAAGDKSTETASVNDSIPDAVVSINTSDNASQQTVAATVDSSASASPNPSETAVPPVPIFATTYALPRRMTVVVPQKEVAQPSESEVRSPKILPQGAPQFDSTTPMVLRGTVGEPIKMELVVSGEGPLYYQWETWDEAKGISVPIDGCNEPFLAIALEPEDSMLAFQCRVNNAACPEGVVSRTFFLKKVVSAQRSQNSFGEKFVPPAPKGKFTPGRV
ncbi:MAG: hypothetical protein WCL08_07895 [Verrucomicrobiota bacterium]